MISVVIPVLNEYKALLGNLPLLQSLREEEHEIILVDGGSTDGGPQWAEVWTDQLLAGPAGRASQMNLGARQANGDILLFLHIDTRLPLDAGELIEQGLKDSGKAWGRFDARLSGRNRGLRLIESMMNLRSRLTGIATGDQAIFVRRTFFERVGGFPDQPLMEDIALSRRLLRHSRPLCLRQPVVTSSRRWEQAGMGRTVLLMWLLRMAYFLGVSPRILSRWYYGRKEEARNDLPSS